MSEQGTFDFIEKGGALKSGVSFSTSSSIDPRINFVDASSELDWDHYFMLQAMLASYKSKDPNTRVGCVFVDKRHHQITMGYNGTIAGIDETQIPWGNDRRVPIEYQKYGYVIHAEANAITHSQGSLEASVGYVTLFPCNECAKLVASHRVGEIVYLSDKYAETPEVKIAKRIFDLSKIRYRQLSIDSKILNKLNDYFSLLIQNQKLEF